MIWICSDHFLVYIVRQVVPLCCILLELRDICISTAIEGDFLKLHILLSFNIGSYLLSFRVYSSAGGVAVLYFPDFHYSYTSDSM